MGPATPLYPESGDTGARNPFAPPELPSEPIERGEFWRREPRVRYIVLFVLTLASTTFMGALQYEAYTSVVPGSPSLSTVQLLIRGLWYSLPVLAILGAHEFGHYLACIHYRVNASLPYFLPFPLVFTGTLGAVIRIRQPIPGKRALFDIGIAGPIAGFLVALPLLFVSLALSPTIPRMALPASVDELGEPLLFRVAQWAVLGRIPDGEILWLHPMGLAAWFGLLATALNLFPIGQLDGGHITYAVLGRKSTAVTVGGILGLIALSTFVSSSWIVWTVLTVAMLVMLGPHHPRVHDEDVPLDRRRMWLAAFALVIFIVCFTPAPIELGNLVAQP